MPFLTHGSYRIRYELDGPANAPAYVLVNGLTQYADTVNSALERRHTEVRKLWSEALEGVGISAREGNDEKP